MKVLFASSECAPFSKTGGLGDVIGTLPAQLCQLGCDARVILPLHRDAKLKWFNKLKKTCEFYITLGYESHYVGILELNLRGTTYYFVDNEEFFSESIYLGGDAGIKQYTYFSRAVCEALFRLDFKPDILHLNDWHTAICSAMIRTQYNCTELKDIKIVFSIHNLMYQGKTSIENCKYLTGFDDMYFTYQYLESYGCANYLKSALVFSDKIVTPSKTYADEICTEFYGEGLHQVINFRKPYMIGIVNGIDTISFDPMHDRNIYKCYNVNHTEDKFYNKTKLIEELSLTTQPELPMIAMVTRLTSQKGIELVQQIFDKLMNEKISFVILGSGNAEYEDFFFEKAFSYAGKTAVRIGYNEKLAHKIYAASDILLMPSKFEPCGISQMIAQRYGTLPIVRETGGLKDTVTPYNKYTHEGNGFSFANYSASELLDTIKYALNLFNNDHEIWKKLITNAMNTDNSFKSSAKKYLKIYNSITQC